MKILPSAFLDPGNGQPKNYTGTSGYGQGQLPVFIMLALLLSALTFAAIVAKAGLVGGVLLLAAVIGLPAVYAVVVYPEFGIIVLLVSAYLLMWIIRIGVNFPLGTLMDGLQVLLLLGFFIKQKTHRDWSVLKSPISFIIIIWVIYNLLQAFNPVAASRMSWLYTIRTVAVVTMVYYIFVYQIKTVAFIRVIIKVWLALSVFAAIYAYKQEHYGFFAFEQAQLADPLVVSLLFINGVWRKFSIFSDPVAFAYNMVISSLLCFCLLTGTLKTWKKVVLLLLALFFLLNMLYSGTRGAYVLVPAALVLIALLNFSRKVMIISLIAGFCIGMMVVMPTSNPTIVRFQSAFKPGKDESYNVRQINQKRIQPYILSHPIGGGLGATGVWGHRFAPNSYLANFPPDSGYVRVAVELGWVGLLLLGALMFVILRTGIRNYFKIQDPELKSYCLAATTIVFALNIGNFPQEAIVQYPSNILFYLATALITITLRLDKQISQPHESAADIDH